MRSVNECESDETIAMRTWFVVFEHVIRQPASSISGHRRGGRNSAIFRPANQKEDAKSEVSPEVDAGWVAHLLKVL